MISALVAITVGLACMIFLSVTAVGFAEAVNRTTAEQRFWIGFAIATIIVCYALGKAIILTLRMEGIL